MLLLALGTAAVVLAGRQLGTFLAIDAPVEARVMVVEGWLPHFAYRDAAARFAAGGYERVITAGVRDDDDRHTGDGLADDFGVADLVGAGVPPRLVSSAIAADATRDRTWHAAVAVGRELDALGLQGAPVNIVTVGPHARRSLLLFERALGNRHRVGIVALDDRRYDLAHWWGSSEGVRTVIGEAIAYAYARLLFVPAG